MTAFWYFLGSIFQALFSIMPSIGAIVNIFLIGSGFIACVIWIRVMVKDRTPEENP